MAGFDTYLEDSLGVLAETRRALATDLVERAASTIAGALAADKPLLICGNGGSAADATHIAGELVGRFLRERRALKAISLATDPAVLTAWSNDVGYDSVFARQVEAYGERGGVLLAISTSGNSRNVVAAVEAAQARGMTTIGLTGKGGGKLGPLVHILLAVPATSTPLIQQAHLVIYHYLCAAVEERIAAGP